MCKVRDESTVQKALLVSLYSVLKGFKNLPGR